MSGETLHGAEYKAAYRVVVLGSAFDSTRMLIGAVHSYFLLQRGVSLTDLAYLQIVFLVSSLLFELPTGLLAVHWGNKASMVLAGIFTGTFYLMALNAPSMNALSAAEISYALGLAFSSGALEAWWTGEIRAVAVRKSLIPQLTYLKTELTSLGNMFMGLAGAAVATFMKEGLVCLYVASAIAMFVLSAVFLAHPQALRVQPDKPEIRTMSYTYAASLLRIALTPGINLKFVFVSCIIAGASQLIYHYWQPYFLELSSGSRLSTLFPSETLLLGIVFASYAGLKYVVNRHIRMKLLHMLDADSVGCICAAVCAALIAFLPYLSRYNILFGIACFAAFHSSLAVVSNAISAQFFERLDRANAAGVLSAASLLSRLAGILSLSLVAAVVSWASLEQLFSLLALPFLMVSATLILWRTRSHG